MFYILLKPGDWFWTNVKFLQKFRESLSASRNLDGGRCLPRGQIQLGVQISITVHGCTVVWLHIKRVGTVAVLQVTKVLLWYFLTDTSKHVNSLDCRCFGGPSG